MKRHRRWKRNQKYEFELWKDLEKSLARYYGAARFKTALYPNRITLLLDANGKLLLKYTDLDVGTHPKEVLEEEKDTDNQMFEFEKRSFLVFFLKV